MPIAVKLVLACLVAGLMIGGLWLWAPDKSRAELDARYLAGSDEYRSVAGVRLRVRDTGSPDLPAIILLHGFGSSLDTWDAWADRLSRDYRVIRYDLPGFGLTGPDPMGDYSDRRGVEVLAALLDRCGVSRATVIGNSLGGRLAWQFAVARPDRVARLVLISPDGFASPGFEYGKRPSVPLMLRLLPYMLPRALLRMSLAPAYGDPQRLRPATVTRYRDLMLAPGVRDAILARLRQATLQPPEPLLRRIQAPTLVLWGQRDGMIPFRNAADYVRLIPHATLVALPELGHVPFEEDPAQSLQPLLEWLAGS